MSELVSPARPLSGDRPTERAIHLRTSNKEFKPHTSLMRTFYMLRNTFLAVLTVLTVSVAAQAAVTFMSNAGVDTPGLAGFKTYTVTAMSDGAALQGFDFVGDPGAPVDPATSRGIFGPLNQITLFGGAVSTVFSNNNAVIDGQAGLNHNMDSQFLFDPGQLLVIPGSARETATTLQGAFSTSADFGLSVPFAQIVLPMGQTAMARGIAGTTDGMEFPVSFSVGGTVTPPAPVISPVNLGEIEHGNTIMQQLMASNGPNTWSGLTPTAGTPGMAATLTPEGLFSWNPTGSARGPKGNGVLYSWTATATNGGGADTRVAISLSLIPEPATMSLLALALVGFVGFRKR
jgi:hypothetical protein